MFHLQPGFFIMLKSSKTILSIDDNLPVKWIVLMMVFVVCSYHVIEYYNEHMTPLLHLGTPEEDKRVFAVIETDFQFNKIFQQKFLIDLIHNKYRLCKGACLKGYSAARKTK